MLKVGDRVEFKNNSGFRGKIKAKVPNEFTLFEVEIDDCSNFNLCMWGHGLIRMVVICA